MLLLEPARRSDGAGIARVKHWARDVWSLDDDASVMVAELRCSEPGCLPLETVVVITPGPGQTFQHKFHKSVVDLARRDLVDAAAADGTGPSVDAFPTPEPTGDHAS